MFKNNTILEKVQRSNFYEKCSIIKDCQYFNAFIHNPTDPSYDKYTLNHEYFYYVYLNSLVNKLFFMAGYTKTKKT